MGSFREACEYPWWAITLRPSYFDEFLAQSEMQPVLAPAAPKRLP
jgi:hypothetical protein